MCRCPLSPFFPQLRIIISLEALTSDKQESGDEGDTATGDHKIVYVPDAMCFSIVSALFRRMELSSMCGNISLTIG